MKKLLLFVLMLLPMVASADDSGKCGDNVYYSYNATNHTLTIYGEGDMHDYSYGGGDYTPWYLYLYDIQSVIIESGVTSIGVEALSRREDYYCKNLTSVTIPNSVTSIGSEAFYGCSSLTSITIPNSVTTIAGGAFYDCGGLTSIQVESGNQYYDSRNNCNAIIDSNNQLILGCKNTIIPNSVTSIGSSAFNGCTGLTSITIPNSVTSIGVNAFGGCNGLTSVTIGNNVTSIGSSAFSGCTGLTSITIPNSVTSIGDNAFGGCNGLTSVTIGNNVTSIGDGAFQYCSGLTSITIPNSVTTIGWWAFTNCNSLTSVTIGNNVKYIEQYAFSHCKSLVCMTFLGGGTEVGYCCFESSSNLTYIYCNEAGINHGDPGYGCGNFTLYVPAEPMDAYKKCSKPTISLSDGRFVFNSETPDVQYRWVITPVDNQGYLNSGTQLTLNVFATKDGYQPSDVATYTLSGTPVPAPVVGNPVITFSLNIINRSGKDVTLDGTVEFLLGNPDHNGTYLGWESSYNYTDPIRFSSSPVTLAAGETKTFDGLTWRDEETGSGMGEKSPLDPSQWASPTNNRNVKLYVGGSDEIVVCDNMDPSIIFKEGGIYSIVISSGENTTPVNPTPLVGDVNGDGKVNVADHVKLSEIIMEQDK